MSEAKTAWEQIGSRSVDFEMSPYEMAARLFDASERVAAFMQFRSSTYGLLRSIERAGLDAAVFMFLMGATNWHFRGRLNEAPPRFASPEVMTAPLRRYASLFLRHIDEDQTKDAITCLELYIVALEHLYAVLGGGSLSDAILRELRETEAAQ